MGAGKWSDGRCEIFGRYTQKDFSDTLDVRWERGVKNVTRASGLRKWEDRLGMSSEQVWGGKTGSSVFDIFEICQLDFPPGFWISKFRVQKRAGASAFFLNI